MSRFALACLLALVAAPAAADSCWWHNGSLMRLQASGDWRTFTYENPRDVLRGAGVRRGTVLFEGRKVGEWYTGTARVFSRFCPNDPYEYAVEGPVGAGPSVTVEGWRETFRQCAPDGGSTRDRLVFTYAHDC